MSAPRRVRKPLPGPIPLPRLALPNPYPPGDPRAYTDPAQCGGRPVEERVGGGERLPTWQGSRDETSVRSLPQVQKSRSWLVNFLPDGARLKVSYAINQVQTISLTSHMVRSCLPFRY